MSNRAVEFNVYGRSVALVLRHWRGVLRRLRQSAQTRLLNIWASVSPATYERVRERYHRGDVAALPPWGDTVTVDGIVMRIDERMSVYNVRKLISGRHTRHERDLIGPVLAQHDVVMELGGGIGMLAIACARKIGSQRVFSYEANPQLESLIRDNYALNGVAPTLRICMLGPEAGSQTFHVSKLFSRSSAHATFEDSQAIEVPVQPFNSEIRRIKPTVLIVDIQGGEAELFDYADLSTVDKLLVEVHPDIIGITGANSLRRRLRRLGFAEQTCAGQSFLYVRRSS